MTMTRLNQKLATTTAMPGTIKSKRSTVEFQDESRHIASEYRGGLERYSAFEKTARSKRKAKLQAAFHQQNHYQCIPLPLSPPELQAHLTHDDSHELKYSPPTSSPSSMAKSYPESRLSSPNQVRTVGWTDSTEDSSYVVFPNTAAFPHYLSWPYNESPQMEKFPGVTKRFGDSQGLFGTAVALKEAKDVLKPARYIMVRDPRASLKPANKAPHDGIGGDDDATLPLMSKPATGEREFLRTADELAYMQVFVEHVAVWMDSFDREKHFSHTIPYRALKSPMLLNSLLACGVRHLSMQDADKIHTAQFYYNTATTQLLRNLENPERDTTECAAAAVILKVCERMSKKTCRRMSHVSGARVLMIRDCGWDANSTGLGLACFWLNIYLEVLSSLESDCAVSLPPSEWGLDMGWMSDSERDEDACVGEEETWIQRMLYILARVADFQTFAGMFGGNELSGEKMRLEYRLPEWRNLKHLCDRWNDRCPRTMHPLGYLNRGQTSSTSLFPKVWLPKREAVLGRLLYHTAQCILTQTNPMEQAIVTEEMRALQIHHAHEVCGLVAHTEERRGAGGGGLAFLSVRSLIIASRVLVDHGEQTEVLQVLRRMHDESGWISEDVERELKTSWGWDADAGDLHLHHGQRGESESEGSTEFRFKTEAGVQDMMGHPTTTTRQDAGGLLGMPVSLDVAGEKQAFLHASFHDAKHPYQGWYEPPSQATSLYSYH